MSGLIAHNINRLLRGPLARCGYDPECIREEFQFADAQDISRIAPLAAFAHTPYDARSACLAAIESVADDATVVSDVSALRDLGAPISFVLRGGRLEWWEQHADVPRFRSAVPSNDVANFFDAHVAEFDPRRVYRAKTRGRFEGAHQLEFVDYGLVPAIESQLGAKVGRLVERVVGELKRQIAPHQELNSAEADWVLQAAFWLLAAKILRDKNVPNFATLDLRDVDTVWDRVSKHYGAEPLDPGPPKRRQALGVAATVVARFAHFGQVTTESLAYVYENTLVSKATRKDLGTHSTPPYLVDYVVGRLAPWVDAIPVEERLVFEPACGHAAFLVSAMRLLRDLHPDGRNARSYLQKRLRGIEVDKAAYEIARLSLTLADIPHPNRWQLRNEDMYATAALERNSASATILLSNPPFENFSREERDLLAADGRPAVYVNKAAEMLRRALPKLPDGAVFGVVLPQTLLRSAQVSELRRMLTTQFELLEICLFPDGVFSFSDAESAIVLGRRCAEHASSAVVKFGRVREPDVDRFRLQCQPTATRLIPQRRFAEREHFDLRVPDLEPMWNRLEHTARRLMDIATVTKGLEYKGRDLPTGARTIEAELFDDAERGFANPGRRLLLHGLPTEVWMNLDPNVIRRMNAGAAVGFPQVLVCYHPVSRGPWRIKAVIDRTGHAVTSSFLAVRPTDPLETPLEMLWALCVSPIASAYSYAFMSKRDIPAGDLRRLPIPAFGANDAQRITDLVREYFIAASDVKLFDPGAQADEEYLHKALCRIDAEVLRLYDMPARMERELLDLFQGVQREGVAFPFTRYFPESFEYRVSLGLYLALTGYGKTNGRGLTESVASPYTAAKVPPRILDDEVDAIYEELAELERLRELYQRVPVIAQRIDLQFARLRALQDTLAEEFAKAFDTQFVTSDEETPEDRARADELVRAYGNFAGPYGTTPDSTRTKT
ncbi:MAG TPA: N-6 DNA methylase [Polyangiaceae bacterium]|nr:N-6 DNA methylase [Polyangiaceae bacterium]